MRCDELLVCVVCGKSNSEGHKAEGHADGLGAVATIFLALAHKGVVLLKNGLEKIKIKLRTVKRVSTREGVIIECPLK